MDSLLNILSNKDFDEPSEIGIIKGYARKKYNSNVRVKVREKDILISASSAALANSLRLQSPEIKKLCNTTKRLIFKIG
jgi:hypothetical protein